jgi:hypothetical protein
MRKRLSKISRELNSPVSVIVEFLRANGYECDEDPNETISKEVSEIIQNNFPAFIAQKQSHKETVIGKETELKNQSEKVPLELRIIEAASKEKKLIERIIGFTEFDWNFIIAKYGGECIQPVEFTLFDEVLCELLLVEKMSLSKISDLLGFNLDKDPAEREIIKAAIQELRNDKMLDGNDDELWLTETGKEYAKNGVKFSTFKRNFELYFDLTGGLVENAKNIFGTLKSEKTSRSISQIPVTLEDIRKLAEYQAPEIHFPSRNYQLKSADFISAESYKANVWVVLLENFRDNSLRTVVYEEKQDAIIDDLSEILNQNESIKAELLTKLVKIDDSVEFTEEEKKEDQIQLEKELIVKQEEIDKAIDQQDAPRLQELKEEVEVIKRHFNSLEFEVELKNLFDNTSDELWIISPWIKNATFRRVPFFEKYLKKGGRIFVAYSEPEDEGQIMALDEPLNRLLDLEKRYQNFYLHQLPPFHYKNVWLRRKEGKDMYYTGSYNILSFFVSQGLTKVRQEKMTRLDWNNEVQQEFMDVIQQFGLKYLNKSIEDFNKLCQNPPPKINREYLQKLRTVDSSKLKPFLNLGVEDFDKAVKALEETKLENLNLYRKRFFEAQIQEYKNEVADLAKQKISFDRKKTLQRDFEKLRDENMDFLDLQMGHAKEVFESINHLPTYKFHVIQRRKG